MCYNAGYVLAQELSSKIKDKTEKVIVVAPDGVVQELKAHGFTNLDTLENSASRGMGMEEFQNLN